MAKLLDENSLSAIKTYVDGKFVVANTAITGATKCKITYDAKGLVTAGADLADTDIPSLGAAKITSGTFDVARIPTLSASSKLSSGSASSGQALVADGSGGVGWSAISVPVSDVQIGGTSIVSSRVANIVTNGTYNATTNKIATMNDLPSPGNGTLTIQANGSSKGTFTANQSSNTTINITASDLGLASAMHFIGVTTSNISDGSTTNPVVISGSNVTAVSGDVVIKDNQEFIWNGSLSTPAWELLGDESSYALNSVTITGTGVLGGGGAISSNQTITHNEVLGTAQTTAKVFKVKLDKYGHVSEATAAGASDVGAVAANSAITGNTKCKITYDSKGLVTAGADLTASDIPDLSATYQPLDADLTAIGALTGTSGLLKKTAANTWALDTNTYALSSAIPSNFIPTTSSAGTALTFNTTSTNPSKTNRLNLEAYLYATKLYSGGSEVAVKSDLSNLAGNSTYCLTEQEALAILNGTAS